MLWTGWHSHSLQGSSWKSGFLAKRGSRWRKTKDDNILHSLLESATIELDLRKHRTLKQMCNSLSIHYMRVKKIFPAHVHITISQTQEVLMQYHSGHEDQNITLRWTIWNGIFFTRKSYIKLFVDKYFLFIVMGTILVNF